MNCAVVAIPVRDEAKRIINCLAALSNQSYPADHVVLLLNNCTDDTAAVVKALPDAPHRLHLVECKLEGISASAGVARRLAMEHAASLIAPSAREGVILTTDADGEVPATWIAANLRAIVQGADAVCGQAVIDPVEALLIPSHLHEDDAREVAYGRLLDEIESIVLPNPSDPWPRHTEDSGASIAITASMYRQVGGLPFASSGEDRALIRRLNLIDARIRHDPKIKVLVSGRIEGRAQGGMADTIRRRIIKQDEFVDERIQPAWAAFHRLRIKRRFTLLWQHPTETGIDQLAKLIAIAPNVVADATGAGRLGLGWSKLEQAAHQLSQRQVRFSELPLEMSIARGIRRSLLSRACSSAELTAA